MKVLDKLDKFISETDFAAKFLMNTSKYKGHRPVQFMKWWENYRPGDRVNINFSEEGIEIFGTNAEGQFAGARAEKELFIDDPDQMDLFKSSEGDIWNFV